MQNKCKLADAIEALNQPELQLNNEDRLYQNWNEIVDLICDLKNKAKSSKVLTIALDGYIGTDWHVLTAQLKELFNAKQTDISFLNVESCLKNEKIISEELDPYLGSDPVFGRVYKNKLKTLFDINELNKFKIELKNLKNTVNESRIIICYGTGVSMRPLRSLFDSIFYIDLTREEVLKRSKNWTQLAGKTQSISPKKLYYIDFQVNDKHRKESFKYFDYYIDGNQENSPKMVGISTFQKITATLSQYPFRLKPMYEPGPWGGQWLKKQRNLPKEWVNCAWSFEVIAQEMSLLVVFINDFIDIPWNTFFELHYDQIMGAVSKNKFGGEFPIRYDYLDTMDGGDLSVQVHPTSHYIKKNFNEPYHQGEMYYIVDGKKKANVNLGLNEDTDEDKFLEAATLADEKGIKFDYTDFVNHVPAQKHDLLMVPPEPFMAQVKALLCWKSALQLIVIPLRYMIIYVLILMELCGQFI